MNIHWICQVCDEAGETTGTESGQDVKHVKATTHSVITGLDAAALARIAERRAA